MPAEAGIQALGSTLWIPAFAGRTAKNLTQAFGRNQTIPNPNFEYRTKNFE